MGHEPPAQADPMSPVQQITSRQPHITQSLGAISQTACTMRTQQLAEVQLQQGSAAPLAADAVAADCAQPRQLHTNVVGLMANGMTALSSAAASPNPMQQMASAMASAILSSIMQVLKQQQEQAQADKRQLQEQLDNMSSRLQSMDCKMESNASFYPLMSTAMSQLCHQVNGLAQYLVGEVLAGLLFQVSLVPLPAPGQQWQH